MVTVENLPLQRGSALKLPTFIVLGEQKCGTGWIRDRLREHPGVFMAANEVNFFNRKENFNRGLPTYARVFREATVPVLGEKSPEYFWQNSGLDHYNQDILGLIDRTLPEVKVILVLRDPARRAVSAVQHHLAHRGRRIHPKIVCENSISEILLSGRFNFSHLGILERGFYADRISTAMQTFGSRLKILIFERDIVSDPKRGLDEICDHIGVTRFNGFTYEDNAKATKRSYGALLLSYYFPPLRPLIRQLDFGAPFSPTITEKCREELKSLYAEDVIRVQKLTGEPVAALWGY